MNDFGKRHRRMRLPKQLGLWEEVADEIVARADGFQRSDGDQMLRIILVGLKYEHLEAGNEMNRTNWHVAARVSTTTFAEENTNHGAAPKSTQVHTPTRKFGYGG